MLTRFKKSSPHRMLRPGEVRIRQLTARFALKERDNGLL